MGVKASKVIEIGKSQLGYIGKKLATDDLDSFEAPHGSGEYTKYARDMYEAGFYNGNKQGYDGWCTVGSDWCFYKAAGSKEEADKVNPIGELGAGANWAYKDYKNAKLIVDIPEPGDRVFFLNSKGEAYHVGIAVDVNHETKDISTLEFNGNGNVVYIRDRNYGVTGMAFGRPNYEPESIPDIEVGDKVMIRDGALVYDKDYTFSSWVYKTEMYVRAINGDKITISTQMTGNITGNVNICDVIPIDIPDPDLIEVSRGQIEQLADKLESMARELRELL